mgnify:CR=1 FL=1
MIKVLFFLLAFVPSIAFGAVLENNEGTSIDTENYGAGSNKGQSFIHSGADYDIESVEIWGGLGDSPASTIEVRVYEGEGLGGTLLCNDTGIDVTGWPNWSSADWQVISIACSGLLDGDVYTMAIYPEDGGGSDAIRWATNDTSYSNGQEYYNGTGRPSRDTMFRINGTEAVGGGGTTTATSTLQVVVNASQDYFNAILLFYLTMFGMLYLFRKRT